MITITNKQRLAIFDMPQLEVLIHEMLHVVDYPTFDLGVMFCGAQRIQQFNKKFRSKDKPTDVLSFPYHADRDPDVRIAVKDDDEANLGDIIICPTIVAQRASQYDRTFEQHMVALIAHGVAHLLGHDHQTDEEFAVMDRLEKKLIAAAIAKVPHILLVH